MKADDFETMCQWLDAEVESEIIKRTRWTTVHSCVFKHNDGKHYQFTYGHQGEEGIVKDGPWEAIEVEKQMLTTHVWLPVHE